MAKYLVVDTNNTPIFEMTVSGALTIKYIVNKGYRAKLRQDFFVMGFYLAMDPNDGLDIYVDPHYCDIIEVAEPDTTIPGDNAAINFVNIVKSQVGKPYVYGMKGDILTQKKLESLRVTYPSMFTKTYYNKAKAFIGKQCFDCSGLVTWSLNKAGIKFPVVNAHTLYHSHCYDISKSSLQPGDLLFRQGSTRITHVAVYIGNNEIVEARGIDYGVVRRQMPNTFQKFGRLHVLANASSYTIPSDSISIEHDPFTPKSYEITTNFDVDSVPRTVKNKVAELNGNLLLYYKDCVLYNVKVTSSEKKNNVLILEWSNLSNKPVNLHLTYEIQVF